MLYQSGSGFKVKGWPPSSVLYVKTYINMCVSIYRDMTYAHIPSYSGLGFRVSGGGLLVLFYILYTLPHILRAQNLRYLEPTEEPGGRLEEPKR